MYKRASEYLIHKLPNRFPRCGTPFGDVSLMATLQTTLIHYPDHVAASAPIPILQISDNRRCKQAPIRQKRSRNTSHHHQRDCGEKFRKSTSLCNLQCLAIHVATAWPQLCRLRRVAIDVETSGSQIWTQLDEYLTTFRSKLENSSATSSAHGPTWTKLCKLTIYISYGQLQKQYTT